MFPNYHTPDVVDTGPTGSRILNKSPSRSWKELLTVLALSVHTIFEGLAVGLASSEPDVWILLAGIGILRLLTIFVVGLELVMAGISVAFFVLYMATYVLIPPLGLGLGLVISETTQSREPSTILTGTPEEGIFREVLECLSQKQFAIHL